MSSPDESGIDVVHDMANIHEALRLGIITREQVDPAMLQMLDDFKRKADA